MADTNSKRRKGRKKDKVEIMISVGGKRREVLSTEEGAERGGDTYDPKIMRGEAAKEAKKKVKK